MRTELEQALYDAKEVMSWLEDNNEGNTNVGFAFTHAQLQSVISYLEKHAALVRNYDHLHDLMAEVRLTKHAPDAAKSSANSEPFKYVSVSDKQKSKPRRAGKV